MSAPLFCGIGSLLCAGFLSAAAGGLASAQTTNDTFAIDLPTALRLAGAQNLDVQIAQEHVREAEANRTSAMEQFLPWLSPGVGYHRRDGVAQAVPSGIISDAHYQSYSPGVTLAAQLTLGEAIYASLAAKQLVRASGAALEAKRQEVVVDAAQKYFDLANAQSQVAVLAEAAKTSQEYLEQLQAAVSAGIAFKGDELRVQSETEQYRLRLRQANEKQKLASAELAQTLHLDARIELIPLAREPVPLALFQTNISRDTLVREALLVRPELKVTEAHIRAARAAQKGATYGAWVPSLGAQVFGGGLGGGPDSGPHQLGAEADYTVGLSWRIGPGGLFDSGRTRAAESRSATARLDELKIRDLIVKEVVSEFSRFESLGEQMDLSRQNLATATETLRLTKERQQYGVGIVLEAIQAQQALTQARSEYCRLVADYNKAQYALEKASGQLSNPGGAASR